MDAEYVANLQAVARDIGGPGSGDVIRLTQEVQRLRQMVECAVCAQCRHPMADHEDGVGICFLHGCNCTDYIRECEQRVAAENALLREALDGCMRCGETPVFRDFLARAAQEWLLRSDTIPAEGRAFEAFIDMLNELLGETPDDFMENIIRELVEIDAWNK